MRRPLALALTGLVLMATGACASVAEDRSYSLGRGIVNYDELRRAGDKCQAEGGSLQAKMDGGDPAQLSNYTCVIPKVKRP
ncbi:hypothetical protein DDF62_13300 [Caulobacter radicis]|uniref:hypothetical protein n=1 Tax=Caulobacter radicis TaxID=2172650 RepID=UPI000D57FD10|nr:hypothetical protein [Caulobacter radicis]PVM88894.1 hypothetical protein DDF62_13300 [Caulobacter radicis]